MDIVLVVSLYIIVFVVGLSISYWIIKTAVKNGVKAAFSDMDLVVPQRHTDLEESTDEATNSDSDDTEKKYKWYE